MDRFSKGTLDHDGDGRKGGSRKAKDMAKAPAKKTAAKPAVKADGQNIMNSAAAEQADTANTTENGMDQGPSPKEQRAELNAKFEKADAKAQAAIIDETQVGLQVRGY